MTRHIVICGGGSAGCVLVARLTGAPHTRVREQSGGGLDRGFRRSQT